MHQTHEAHSERASSAYDQSLEDSSERLRTSVSNQDVMEYQKAQIAGFAQKNFSQLDQDSDGYIEFAEIDRLSHRSTVDDDPNWFEMLDLLKKNYDEVKNANWDQWVREKGISPGDLIAFSKKSRQA